MLFSKPSGFRPIEQMVLDRVVELLSEPAKSLLLGQLKLVNSIQRLYDDKEVDLRIKGWFRTIPMPEAWRFRYPKSEYKLARIRLISSRRRFG